MTRPSTTSPKTETILKSYSDSLIALRRSLRLLGLSVARLCDKPLLTLVQNNAPPTSTQPEQNNGACDARKKIP